MRSGPDFFGDCTQSGPESQDRTVSQSRLDWTAKSYFGPVSKFGTGLLTNRSGPVSLLIKISILRTLDC
jgi:hypothetical protein